MKAASPDFKRKVHKGLQVLTNPFSMIAAAATLFAACVMPILYQDNIAKSAADKTAQEQEFNALEKRIAGIPPMRKYVNQLQEQAEVVLKLPADALPAGTDPQKLRAQGEKLSAAYAAEVKGTAIAIWLSPHLTLGKVNELGRNLESATKEQTMEAVTGGNLIEGAFSIGFEKCRAKVAAEPGYKPDETAVRRVIACTKEDAAPYNRLALGTLGGLVLVFAGAGLLSRRLGKQIAADDQTNAAIAAGIIPAPAAPAINTSTGQDITVKPIKITTKTSGFTA